MAAETTLTPTRDQAAADAKGQSRTALVSIAAATLLVVLTSRWISSPGPPRS